MAAHGQTDGACASRATFAFPFTHTPHAANTTVTVTVLYLSVFVCHARDIINVLLGGAGKFPCHVGPGTDSA